VQSLDEVIRVSEYFLRDKSFVPVPLGSGFVVRVQGDKAIADSLCGLDYVLGVFPDAEMSLTQIR
jgi:hypothetical protein